MPLASKDVRFMVRRSADGTPTIHPRLLRDRSIVTSVDVALQYFETLLGSERRELDPEALVHFLGDYKVARGIVASLGRAYRYRTPRLDQLVTRGADAGRTSARPATCASCSGTRRTPTASAAS